MHCVLLFSAAVDIDISYPRWATVNEREDSLPPPPGSVGFTGVLHLRGFVGRWPEFFELLSTQPIRFQKTRLIGCDFQSSIPAQSLLVATSHCVRTIQLVAVGNRGSNFTLFTRTRLTATHRTPPRKPYASRLPCSRKPCIQNVRGRHERC
jgi:hypothetical protein